MNILLLLAIGFIGSVLGGCVVLAGRAIVVFVREGRGPFAGAWEDRIYDETDHVVKRDRIEVRQGPRSDYVHGRIRRFYPQDQRYREWNFAGRIRDGNFFAAFWSVDRAIRSYGCWYLQQVSDFRFEGYYLWRPRGEGEDIPKIKVALVRPEHDEE